MENRPLITGVSESDITPMVRDHFVKRGWRVTEEVKLRGRVADVVAAKGGEVAVVEVKGGLGDLRRGIEQTLHYGHAANYAYLAIPEQRSDKEVVSSCRSLGLGLLLVGDRVAEAVRPKRSEALASVREAVTHIRPRRQASVHLRSGLERLFGSRPRVLVLKLLILDPESSLHLNEIARRTGLSPSAVLKECSILLGLGLVKKESKGNLTLYEMNRGSVMHEELKRIFLKYEFLDQLLAERLTPERVRYALIFGSFAKGTETQASDIDLLVIADTQEEALSKAIHDVERATGREVNYILWTPEELEQKARERSALVREISKTPVIMVIGDEDEFKRVIENRRG